MAEAAPHSESKGSAPDTGAIQLKISSDPANLAPVRHAVETLCRNRGFNDTATGEVGLCLNEALANVMRHAYGGARDQPIEIVASCPGQVLTITVRDWGCGKDPATMPPRPHVQDPLKPGGVGMICLRKLMDQITYTPQSDGMLLTMTRHRNSSPR
jgi:anti-sigma regulatory factor (Ser/Thr protein kinase)